MSMSWKKTGMVAALAWMLAGCSTTKIGFPDAKDVNASVATKPKPGPETLEPGGNAKYNAKLEAWGDGISSSAGIICRFLAERGMEGITCPPRPEKEN